MTEQEARDAVVHSVGPEAMVRLERLASLVLAENERQNLIARSTIDRFWGRHILDSIQLMRFAPDRWSLWIDIGTGGGFPGLAIACAASSPVLMVEPRPLRSRFLKEAVGLLGLSNTRVAGCKIQDMDDRADVISARAVSMPEKLLRDARSCAIDGTLWVLPRGQMMALELAALQKRHREMMFHVEQSVSDPESMVLVGRGRPA